MSWLDGCPVWTPFGTMIMEIPGGAVTKKTKHWESMRVGAVRKEAAPLGVPVRDSKGKLKKKADLIHEMRVAYWRQQKGGKK